MERIQSIKTFLLKLFLLCLVLCCFPATPSCAFDFETEIRGLDTLNVDQFRLEVDTLYFELERINDVNIKKTYTDRLFAITEERDELAHIRSLVYPSIYPDSIKMLYMNEAFEIAKRLNSVKELAWLEERRCRYYMTKAQYDSAMVSLLKLRDEYSPSPGSDEYLNIENLLGDIYYKSGMYEKAMNVYQNIYQEFVKQDLWNYWRPYVIMNNMGLIGIETNNYQLAESWFNKSLQKARHHLMTPEKNNVIAYILGKLMEINIKRESYDVARDYLQQIYSIPQDEIYTDVHLGILYLESTLLLNEEDAVGALEKAQALLAYSRNRQVSVGFAAEIDLLLSQIYKAQGERQLALQHLEKYTVVNDSLMRYNHSIRSLLILAENDHNFTKEKLKAAKREELWMIFFMSFILLALVVVSLFYRRLYLSKLQMVNDTVEKELKGEKQSAPNRLNELPKDNEQQDDTCQLIARLDELIAEKKIYLDPELNIQKTAEYLSTNRTYLSTAINNTFNMNFPTYINRLRIQESIHLISEGFTETQTLEALATQCGFANRVVFVAAFKKYTGVTPSFFIKNFEHHRFKLTEKKTDPVL